MINLISEWKIKNLIIFIKNTIMRYWKNEVNAAENKTEVGETLGRI